MAHHVLLATDFSEPAQRAYPYAVRLAHALRLPIRLLWVYEDVAPTDVQAPDPGPLVDHIARAAEERLREDAAVLTTADVAVGVRFRMGHAAQEIVREASEETAAVVLAAHGHSRLRRALLGSTTRKVVRRSPVPVLVVGVDVADRPIRRIVLAVDFSEVATGALSEALRFAAAFAVPVEIFHADVPRAPLVFTGLERTVTIADEPAEKRRVRIHQGLERFAAAAASEGVEVTTYTEEALRAADGICRRAVAADAGLVIVSSHGARGFERLLLGSVAQDVVHQCARPVLVVKPPRLAGR